MFAADADIDQRVVWKRPFDEIVVFEAHDFGVGGIDHFFSGLEDSPGFAGTTRYEQIVAGEVIVFTERLMTTAGDLLAVSLVTRSVTLERDGTTVLTITDLVTPAAGDGTNDGSRYGYCAMLDQLDAHLSKLT